MQTRFILLVLTAVILAGFSRPRRVEEIKFVCLKTHKATNTCHFNFKVDGANYRYVDIGCKYSKKQDKLMKKVEEGSIFLAKDWVISCPEPKGDEQKQ